MKRELTELLERLRDTQEPLGMLDLTALSNLTREESEHVADRWPHLVLGKRRQLLAMLGAIADEDVRMDFTALFRQALDDSDATVRRLAVEGLWEDESISLIRPLLSLLGHDPSDEVRSSAALGLARFLDLAEMEFIPRERADEIVEALLAQINEPRNSVEVRRRALEALAVSSDERVSGVITRAYEDATDLMRISALFAMGRSGIEAWSGTVRSELNNPDPRFRFEAVRAAGELGDRKAAPILAALTQEADPAIREMAIWALGQVGGSVAKGVLQRLAKQGGTKAIRRQAREALAELALLDEETTELMLPGWGEEEEGQGDEVLLEDIDDEEEAEFERLFFGAEGDEDDDADFDDDDDDDFDDEDSFDSDDFDDDGFDDGLELDLDEFDADDEDENR